MTPWVRWENIVVPKGLGGWGLKKNFHFAKSLAAKGSWRILQMDNLWTYVMIQKYIEPFSLEYWIRRSDKTHAGGSIFCKVVVKSFDVIGVGLAWCVKNGRKIRVGEDLWAGCLQQHLLLENTIPELRNAGIFCYYSECTQVVKGTPRGNSKTTLGRYWYLSQRGISQHGLNKLQDQIVTIFKRFIYLVEKITYPLGNGVIYIYKDSQNAYTGFFKGKIIT